MNPHPDNPRGGNVDAIAESVAANGLGFYGAIVAQRSTGFVLAGNHRLLAAKQQGLAGVPVVWLDEDAGRWVRVINSLYVEVPRKNGKTTLSGGIAIYLTCADGESGAQVVAGATQERQARFLFDPVRQLAQRSPALAPYVVARSRRILHKAANSYFEVISSVADAQHGANLHGAIVDGLHVHPTPDLVEALETGTGSRSQPLVVIITAADVGRLDTIYARKRERIEKLARKVLADESTYGVDWAATESDDPYAETTWQKANPGYGISPTRAYLRRAAKDGSFDVLWRHWAPEAQLRYLDERTAGLASVWVREGWLRLTPGEVCDYDYDHIRSAINADREAFDVREIAYDPWNSTQLVNDLLADDAPMVKMRQGFVSMSPPTKELLRIVLEGTWRRPKLWHYANPIMRWQVDHLVVETDSAGNVKSSKKTSSDKIDGVVGLIMGPDRAINRPPVLTSAYDDGGLTIV